MRPIGMPAIRSMTSTSLAVQSQWTSGTRSSAERRKLRRSCEQFAASRVRSSSSWIVLSNSATTSRGRSRLPSRHSRSTSDAAVCISARSCSITSATFGRSTLTATGVPSGSSREMDLRDRRARHRRQVERPEHVGERPAEHADDRRFDLLRRERRHAILQQRELVGDVGRQQVAPRRQHLAELDEDRAEVLERTAQAHAARRRQVAPEQHGANDAAAAAARARARARGRRDRAAAQRRRSGEADPGACRIVTVQSGNPFCTGIVSVLARTGVTRPEIARYKTKRGRRLRGGLAGVAGESAAGAGSCSRGAGDAGCRVAAGFRRRSSGFCGAIITWRRAC